MKFNHTTFFDEYKKAFNTKLTQSQVDGLESILNSIEQDPDITDVRWAAYMLATVKHECADRWQPAVSTTGPVQSCGATGTP